MGTVRIGGVVKSSPSTQFWLEADWVGQNWDENFSVLGIWLRAANGPNGSTGSFQNGEGYQNAHAEGYVYEHRGNPFLPSGYQQNQQRWHDYGEKRFYHDGNGFRGGVGLAMEIGYSGISDRLDSGNAHHGSIGAPGRIPKPPQAPYNLYISNHRTANSFGVTYTRGDNMGAGIEQDHAQWSANGEFTAIVWDDYGPSGYTSPQGGTTPGAPALNPHTTYWVRVRSRNSRGWGGFSGAVAATTLGHPSEPRNVTATASTSVTGRNVITWTAPSVVGENGIKGYNVFRDGTQIATITGDTTTHTDSGRTPFVAHSYTVAARNDYSNSVNGMGPQSSASTVITQGPPSAPRNLVAVSSTTIPGRVDLSWDAPVNIGNGGLTGYRIRLSSGTLLGTVNGSTRTYSVTGLNPGSSYTFKVSARNALSDQEGSEGAFSNNATQTPVGEPQAPRSLTVTQSPTHANRLVLSWQAPAGTLSGYSIFRNINGSYALIAKIGSQHTSYTIDNLSAGVTETFYVRARTFYTDTLSDGYPGNWGGPGSTPTSGAASNNASQSVPSFPAIISGTNAVFNGTYTINAVTATTISYFKSNPNIPVSNSGGSITNITNAAFNGTYSITVPSLTTISYARINANIASLPTTGGTITDNTNVDLNGTYTISAVNVGANLFSYLKNGSDFPARGVPANVAPGQFGRATNLSNAVFNGSGKIITEATEYTIKYVQNGSNISETNAAGIVTNTTNRDVFNGTYVVANIPSYRTVRYLKTAANIALRSWFTPNGVLYRTVSPAILDVRYRSGWSG